MNQRQHLVNAAKEALMSAAAQVDVLDIAGRLLADPIRTVVSRAAMLAIADVMERAWEISLEAELLARAVSMPTGTTELDSERTASIDARSRRVLTLMAALRGETPKETEHGNG